MGIGITPLWFAPSWPRHLPGVLLRLNHQERQWAGGAREEWSGELSPSLTGCPWVAKAEGLRGIAEFARADLSTGQFQGFTKSLLPYTETGPPGLYSDKLIWQKSDKVKLPQIGTKSVDIPICQSLEKRKAIIWATGVLMTELRWRRWGELLLLSGL